MSGGFSRVCGDAGRAANTTDALDSSNQREPWNDCPRFSHTCLPVRPAFSHMEACMFNVAVIKPTKAEIIVKVTAYVVNKTGPRHRRFFKSDDEHAAHLRAYEM